MPFIETPDDLADDLANKLGIYGGHDDETCTASLPCRCCFAGDMAQRIRDAVSNEQQVVGGAAAAPVASSVAGSWEPPLDQEAAEYTCRPRDGLLGVVRRVGQQWSWHVNVGGATRLMCSTTVAWGHAQGLRRTAQICKTAMETVG